ncbi:hypothetical protein HHUSO_G25118 [Huso huso]|uniref:Uncharacterized protein n=1 Tax=Huso huso TaxID=61971 RepID=A0ABR0YSJ5_HUSHU
MAVPFIDEDASREDSACSAVEPPRTPACSAVEPPRTPACATAEPPRTPACATAEPPRTPASCSSDPYGVQAVVDCGDISIPLMVLYPEYRASLL